LIWTNPHLARKKGCPDTGPLSLVAISTARSHCIRVEPLGGLAGETSETAPGAVVGVGGNEDVALVPPVVVVVIGVSIVVHAVVVVSGSPISTSDRSVLPLGGSIIPDIVVTNVLVAPRIDAIIAVPAVGSPSIGHGAGPIPLIVIHALVDLLCRVPDCLRDSVIVEVVGAWSRTVTVLGKFVVCRLLVTLKEISETHWDGEYEGSGGEFLITGVNGRVQGCGVDWFVAFDQNDFGNVVWWIGSVVPLSGQLAVSPSMQVGSQSTYGLFRLERLPEFEAKMLRVVPGLDEEIGEQD
jgi:hypothetical protein